MLHLVSLQLVYAVWGAGWDSRKVTGKCGEVAPLARRPEGPGEGGIVGKVWNDFLPT